MQEHLLESLARELREHLASGALAHRGRVELSDGLTIDPERMARIVLTDSERVTQGRYSAWITEGQEETLYDDLLRLVALARVPVYP
jgi:hypothetical protein